MVGNLFSKMTNFLMPMQEENPSVQNDNNKANKVRSHSGSRSHVRSRKYRSTPAQIKPQLVVHAQPPAPPDLKIIVEEPNCFDDAQRYADYLKKKFVLLINYQKVDFVTQQRIGDFMNGVCYTIGGSVQRVSEQVVLYAYANVDVDKVLFSYSVPTYVRV